MLLRAVHGAPRVHQGGPDPDGCLWTCGHHVLQRLGANINGRGTETRTSRRVRLLRREWPRILLRRHPQRYHRRGAGARGVCCTVVDAASAQSYQTAGARWRYYVTAATPPFQTRTPPAQRPVVGSAAAVATTALCPQRLYFFLSRLDPQHTTCLSLLIFFATPVGVDRCSRSSLST